MTNSEMLEKLKSLTVCAQMTCATMDMGIESVVITSKGAGSNLGDLGQWPCVKFPINDELREKIRGFSGDIAKDIEAIKPFQFFKFCTSTHNPVFGPEFNVMAPELVAKVSESLVAQLKLIDLSKDCFFAYQEWGEVPELTSEFSRLEELFIDNHGYVRAWEKMSEDEIEEWYETAEDIGWTLPCIDFTSDD